MSETNAPPYIPQIRLYQQWLAEHRGLRFESYDALWRWSITELDAFWQSIWDYFDLQSPTPHTAVLAKNVMPGAPWFTGARVNYTQQVFRHVQAAHAAGFPAVIACNEKGRRVELSWPELRRQVASLAQHLQAQGVQPGDRVAAYLPNIPEAMVAFLATVSIGGVWSLCAPDMGTNAVLDRFRQIEPVVLIACDGVSYGGRDFDRLAVVAELRAALPTVRHVVLHTNLAEGDEAQAAALRSAAPCTGFADATARDDAATAAFEPVWLPFDHPLWIVYSSGTTGLPKPIVHGHGGTLIVGLALKILHNDVGCSYQANSWGERYHWYSSTGWVMWNAQTSGLLNGTTCVTYDGNPGGSKDRPDWTTLWRFAAEQGVTFFGAGAAFFANCIKAGVDLSTCGDLSAVRALGTTGSPLSEDSQRWGTEQFARLAKADAQRDDPAQGRPKPDQPPRGAATRAAAERGGLVVGLPVGRDAPLSLVHLVDVGGHKRDHALGDLFDTVDGVGVFQHQHRVRSGGHQVAHHAQVHAFAVDHIQADQVDPVVLAFGRGREGAAGQVDAHALERLGRVAVVHALQLGHQAIGVGLDLGHAHAHAARERRKAAREAGFGRLQEPGGGSDQRRGVGAVGQDADPALDAPRVLYAPQLDGVVGQG